MPSPQRRLGQIASPEMHQSGQDLARECRFLHRNRRSHIDVAHASDLVEQAGCSSQKSPYNGYHYGWWCCHSNVHRAHDNSQVIDQNPRHNFQYNVHNVDYNRAEPGHHLHMSANVPHPPRHALPAVVLYVDYNNTQRLSVQRPSWKPAQSLESLCWAQVRARSYTERGTSKRRIE
ncbi:hypothetical protein ACHAPA_010288 [Fusarium lateritium]